MKTNKLTNKILAVFALVAFTVSSSGWAVPASAAANWDLEGSYVVNFNLTGDPTDYEHEITLSQDEEGNLSGSGASGAYTWEITEGSVEGDAFTFEAEYTATEDAVTPQTVMEVVGVIDEADGSLSGTWTDNYNGGARAGTFESIEGAAEEIVAANVTTDPASDISSTGATLNGTNGDMPATNTSFWWGPSSEGPFTAEADPTDQVPAGWEYPPTGTGAQLPGASFSHDLTSLTPDTEYHFVAWSNVDGIWYPGEVLSFTTDEVDPDPETSTVTIVKYVDGEPATAESADGASFPMISSWVDNAVPGSGSYSLNSGNGYEAVTSEMTNGADYTTSEVMGGAIGATCDVDGADYALDGYSTGDSLEEAEDADVSETAPALTGIESDRYIIVWNDDCSTPGGSVDDGGLGGDVEEGPGVLAVDSIETIDSSAIANNSYADGWEYVFHITVPSNETDIAMKFSDWVKTGDIAETIPAGGNMRISSEQADNEGAWVDITASDTYSSELHIEEAEDLDEEADGIQIEVTVEVKIPVGTESGSYTTNYGVKSEPAI